MAASTTAVRARAVSAAPARPVRRPAVAKQAADHRWAYAATVLRGLARTQQGRPVAQVRRLVRDALTPLGIRLPLAGWAQLATDLAAGRLVTLP